MVQGFGCQHQANGRCQRRRARLAGEDRSGKQRRCGEPRARRAGDDAKRWWLNRRQRHASEPAVTATRLAGAGVAAKVLARVAVDAAALRARGVTPTLAVVLVGDDPASHVYVAKKTRTAAECGVHANDVRLPQDTSQAALLALITSLNNDPAVHGILVQLPLPAHLETQAVIAAIAPTKDVDGLGPVSQGALLSGQRGFVPCTPKGCMALLAETGVPLVGKRAVVLGRSVLVGKPMSLLLTAADLTVTLCHSRPSICLAKSRARMSWWRRLVAPSSCAANGSSPAPSSSTSASIAWQASSSSATLPSPRRRPARPSLRRCPEALAR